MCGICHVGVKWKIMEVVVGREVLREVCGLLLFG